MHWIRARWRPLLAALGVVLLVAAIGFAAPASRPDSGTVLHHLAARWAPEKIGEDACGAVRSGRIGQLIDAEARLTERALRPTGEGWQLRCGYGDSRLGLATATVTVTTGVEADGWQPYRRSSDPEPVRMGPSATVGDETFLVLGRGPGGTSAVRLEAQDGSASVRLEYFAPVRKGDGLPNPVPGLQLVSTVLSRATDPAYDPGSLPSKAYAGCERVKLNAAAEVLGEQLRTARTTYEPFYGRDGDLHCSYAGEHSDLRVTVWHKMDAKAYLEPLRPNLEGIGDAAAFDATVFPDGEARMQATIQVGDSVVLVDGGYADQRDVDRREPTEAERELLESIVRTLA